MSQQNEVATQDTVRVWDVPTRLFHWSLVAVIIFQFVTGDVLDDAMQLHFYGGYVALSLVLFRIVWGFVGSYHARFSHFVVSPALAFRYFKGRASTQEYLGHNPMGAYSVLAILAVVLTQAISGLFMTDDIFLDGPYRGAFDGALDDIMNTLHHDAFGILWYLVALHLVAIAYYSFKKKQKIVPAMLHGKKPLNSQNKNAPHQSVKPQWGRFIIVLLLVVVSVYLAVEVLAPEPEAGLYDFY